ncbi:NADH-quinone oxidoreductase subunit B, partial [Streptomyces sp. SID7499]|nr:NADH-quinone oxidoreductase subunit B [Streptomyces sp. SID7499]
GILKLQEKIARESLAERYGTGAAEAKGGGPSTEALRSGLVSAPTAPAPAPAPDPTSAPTEER